MKPINLLAVTLWSSLLLLGTRSLAQSESDKGADLAKQLANPISALISVPLQGNYDTGAGPTGNGWKFTLNVQPVIPVSISKDWNLINRVILPIVAQKDLFYSEVPKFPGLPSEVRNQIPPALRGAAEQAAEDRYNRAIKKHPQDRYQSGLGDTTASFFLSPKAPGPGGIIWGLGPVLLLPTATDTFLGGEQWGAGPTAVALKQSGPWTAGILANHIWSFAGESDRDDVNTTFVQPFVAYVTKTKTTFTLNTEATYDWNESQWTVPVNLMVAQLLKIGKQPLQVQLGGRYYAEGPSGAPEWGVRAAIVLLFPK